MEKSILLVGEPMGLFIANEVGKLEDVENFSLTTCGAEFNVAVGVTRLGGKVTYMTKLGDDPFGKKIVKMMECTGISTNEIVFSDSRPTGFMFKEKVEEGDPDIFYCRKGSAASSLSASDVDRLNFSKFDVVHRIPVEKWPKSSTKRPRNTTACFLLTPICGRSFGRPKKK